MHFRVGFSYSLWWTSVEIQDRMKRTGKDQDDSQEQNVLHLFIGSLKFSPNPNECHFMGRLQVSLKQEEKWVCDKREELVRGIVRRSRIAL